MGAEASPGSWGSYEQLSPGLGPPPSERSFAEPKFAGGGGARAAPDWVLTRGSSSEIWWKEGCQSTRSFLWSPGLRGRGGSQRDPAETEPPRTGISADPREKSAGTKAPKARADGALRLRSPVSQQVPGRPPGPGSRQLEDTRSGRPAGGALPRTGLWATGSRGRTMKGGARGRGRPSLPAPLLPPHPRPEPGIPQGPPRNCRFPHGLAWGLQPF